MALAKLLLEYRISEPISKEKQDLYSFTDFKPNEFLMYTFTHMRRNKRTIIPK